MSRCILPIHALGLALLLVAGSSFASGPEEKVIYSFQGGSDAALPFANLVADAKGNLYGTTTSGGTGVCQDQDGGSSPCGAVYRLTPPSTTGEAWTETVLHSFQGAPADGAEPEGPLTIDSKGNLYGTTYLGGKRSRQRQHYLRFLSPDSGLWHGFRTLAARTGRRSLDENHSLQFPGKRRRSCTHRPPCHQCGGEHLRGHAL